MLDEECGHALERAERSAMDHDRPLSRAVVSDVFELELLGQLVVDLDGVVGELAALSVLDLEVDLRSVERGLANAHLVWKVQALERLPEGSLGALPFFIRAR